jgi:hypothetical protein
MFLHVTIKYKLFLFIFTRTLEMSTAAGNRRNVTFKVITAASVDTLYFSALVS